jgi:hypothetical protein
MKKVLAEIRELEATFKDGKPRCDMKADCEKPIAYIDNKGFIYCEQHGLQRKHSVPTRKLKPSELKLIESGQPVTKY